MDVYVLKYCCPKKMIISTIFQWNYWYFGPFSQWINIFSYVWPLFLWRKTYLHPFTLGPFDTHLIYQVWDICFIYQTRRVGSNNHFKVVLYMPHLWDLYDLLLTVIHVRMSLLRFLNSNRLLVRIFHMDDWITQGMFPIKIIEWLMSRIS